jgi:hypothetical protein
MLKEVRDDNRENDADHMKPVGHLRNGSNHSQLTLNRTGSLYLFVVVEFAKMHASPNGGNTFAWASSSRLHTSEHAFQAVLAFIKDSPLQNSDSAF